MTMYSQYGKTIDATAARNIVAIQFGAATAVAVFMLAWRALKLKESAVWKQEHAETGKLAAAEKIKGNAHASMYFVARG